MDRALLPKVEELARLLLTPQEIGDILELSPNDMGEFTNPFGELGRLYRRILAERARDLHEKTLQLAMVGSPTAIDEANRYLRQAQNAIE